MLNKTHLPFLFAGLNSPAKHVVPVVAAQTAQPPALQIQQSLLTQVRFLHIFIMILQTCSVFYKYHKL